MSAAAPYAWVEDHEDEEQLSAACFTVVAGVRVEEVLRRFGADPSTERTATLAESFNELTGAAPLLADEVDAGVVVAENNGSRGPARTPSRSAGWPGISPSACGDREAPPSRSWSA